MNMENTGFKLSLGGLLLVLGFITVHAESLDIPGEPLQTCPDGWSKIHRGCYKFVTTGNSWQGALDYCKSERGDLTSIQSVREKEDLQSYLNSEYPNTDKWWVGFSRDGNKGSDWKWQDKLLVSSQVTPWVNARLAERGGDFCGMLQMSNNALKVSISFCSTTQPFICEYHTITPRPSIRQPTEATTPETITELPQNNDPKLPELSQPISQPVMSCDDCPCPKADDVDKADDSEEASSEEGSLSGEEMLGKRNNEALHTGDELYRRYLQSEIDANNAKIAYYAEVSKLYAEALEAQSRYYSSYQTKVDLEIAQLRDGSKCT